jgi:hypothetical protein
MLLHNQIAIGLAVSLALCQQRQSRGGQVAHHKNNMHALAAAA